MDLCNGITECDNGVDENQITCDGMSSGPSCLTLALSPQFVNYTSTSKANTLLFFVEKNVRILCIAKDSHIFSAKNNSVFVILPFEILTNR